MADDTLLLMRLYWKLDRREVARQSKWRLIGMAAAVIGFLFIGAASAAAGYGAALLTRPGLSFRVSSWIVPGVLLTFVFLGVLMTGLGQAVKALYMSGDLDRLVVAPIRARSVLVAKLLSRLPSHFLILLIAAAPAFIAYGIGYRAGPVYYILGLVLLLLAPLFGLAVGALLAMLLARLLPARRLNELLAASYAALGIFIAIAFQFPRFIASDEASARQTAAALGGLATSLERIPLPTFWAGRALMELDALAPSGVGLLGLLAYLLLTAGLFAAVALWADRLYLTSWLRTQSTGGKRRGLEEHDGVFGGRSLPVAIGVKDWLLRLRDPRQLVTLLGGAVILIVVGALTLFRGQGGDTSLWEAASQGGIEAEGLFAVFAAAFRPGVLVAAAALFIALMVPTNAASSALALEGGSFSLLKAAPVTPREVWRAKMWSVMAVFLAIFVLALLVAWAFVRFSAAWIPYALVVGFLSGWGWMTTNVSGGFRFANLAWVDPRRMTTGGGGLIILLLTLVYGIPALVLGVLPFALAQGYPQYALLFIVGGLALLVLLTWAWSVVMARWAVRSWELLPA